MTKIYVSERAKTIRTMARQTLSGRWVEVFKVMMVVYAISMLPTIVIPMISRSTFTISALNVYTMIVSGPISLGISVYFLKVFRQREGGIEDILAAFAYMWKSCVLLLLIAYRILLWSLLFIIPGIIASFRYSQAFFILADNPGKTPSQCIRESKAMMDGNKSRLLWVELSFIGWGILSAIPIAIGGYLFGPDSSQIEYSMGGDWQQLFAESIRVAYEPVNPIIYLFSIGTLFLSAYITVAQACFYDLANGNLQMAKEEEIDTLDQSGAKEEEINTLDQSGAKEESDV